MIYAWFRGIRGFMFVAAVGMVVGPVHAKVTGDVAILKEVEHRYVENREKLQTWRGCVVMISESFRDDALVLRQESKIGYLWDGHRKAARWDWHVTARLLGEGEQSKSSTNCGRVRGFLTKNSCAQYGGILNPKKNPRKVYLMSRRWASDRYNTEVFVPTRYLADDTEGWDVMLRAITESWGQASDDDNKLLVTRKDSLVVINIHSPETTTRYVFDLSKGGNCVKMEADDGSSRTTRTYEFLEVDGVWVPSRAIYDNVFRPSNKHNHREVRWDEQAVNILTNAEDFSLDAIGVVPGTLVQDQRAETVVYRYKTGDH